MKAKRCQACGDAKRYHPLKQKARACILCKCPRYVPPAGEKA